MTITKFLLPLFVLLVSCSSRRLTPVVTMVEAPVPVVTAPAPTPKAIHVVSRRLHIDITTTKITEIFGDVNATMAISVIESLRDTVMLPGPRVIGFDSPGGYVNFGDEIIEAFRLEKKHFPKTKYICVATGGAASMAINIMSQICDVRISQPHAVFLFHRIQTNCPARSITIEEMRQRATQLAREDIPYGKANAKALHMSHRKYLKLAKRQQLLYVPYLLRHGYLQGIVDLLEVK